MGDVLASCTGAGPAIESLTPSPPPGVAGALGGALPAAQGAEAADGRMTDDQRAEIRRRHAAGEDMRAIAAAVGRGYASVRMFLMRETAKAKLADDAFRPVEEVAAAMAESATAVRQEDDPQPADPLLAKMLAHVAMLQPAKGLDAEADLEIFEAFLDGRPGSEVALDLGLDTKAVKQRLDQLTAPLRDVLGKLPRSDSPGALALAQALRQRVAETRRG